MSRYYNQLRGEFKAARPETVLENPPAPVEPVQVPPQIPDVPRNDNKWERFGQCEKVCIAAVPGAPLILGRDREFSTAADSYRGLRTRLLRLMSTKKLRSVVISSPVPAEGKTLTTMNLGLTFARLERMRVLVVDADLRTGGLSRLFDKNDGLGLRDVLEGQETFESTVRSTDVPNLYVVTAGFHSGASAEAFANQRWKEFMSWAAESFDVVLVDAPPILAVADFELIAAACDGTLLIVRALQTSREMLAKAVKLVDAKKFLGLVFNRSNPRNQGGYYGYGAYGSGAP